MTLPEAMTADLDTLFSDFAVDATYTPSGGAASTVKVIFDNKYQVAVDMDGFAGVASSGPAATGKTTDFANAKAGDTLVISGTTYYLKTAEPDGTGISVMQLSRSSS